MGNARQRRAGRSLIRLRWKVGSPFAPAPRPVSAAPIPSPAPFGFPFPALPQFMFATLAGIAGMRGGLGCSVVDSSSNVPARASDITERRIYALSGPRLELGPCFSHSLDSLARHGAVGHGRARHGGAGGRCSPGEHPRAAGAALQRSSPVEAGALAPKVQQEDPPAVAPVLPGKPPGRTVAGAPSPQHGHKEGPRHPPPASKPTPAARKRAPAKLPMALGATSQGIPGQRHPGPGGRRAGRTGGAPGTR